MRAMIAGSGLYTPPQSISNEELVACFNEWVRGDNEARAADIAAGRAEALGESSSEFIVKASGIRNRHVVDRDEDLVERVRHAPARAPGRRAR